MIELKTLESAGPKALGHVELSTVQGGHYHRHYHYGSYTSCGYDTRGRYRCLRNYGWHKYDPTYRGMWYRGF